MGGVISSDTVLEENACLKRFSGLQPISDNDPFWNQLLSFNLNLNSDDRKEVKDFDDSLNDLLQSLMYNTQTTGNFAAFIRVFLRRASEVRTSEMCHNTIFLWQTGNALIILRYICKFLTQRLSEVEFVKVFDKNLLSTHEDSEEVLVESISDNVYANTAEEFLDSLVDIIISLPVNDSTLVIHLESVKCILVILSSQIYHDNVLTLSIFFRYLIQGKCACRSAELTKALLTNYLQHNVEYVKRKEKEPESIILSLAASFWSAVQTAAGVDDGRATANELQKLPPLSLGSISVLLLLNLACHQCTEGKENVYKDALSKFQNAQEVSSVGSDEKVTFKVDYGALYDRLCATVNEQAPMLLLYMLLHTNVMFRNYVLSRINLENLVVPVLRVLHSGTIGGGVLSYNNSHHVYLSLIVILILSEDEFFCKIVHETMIKDTSWVTSDRFLGEMSLGGLVIITFIRTIQMNILKTKDRYLHTNCLAALSNMSSSFKNLSPVVCQRLVGLLELFTRRHAKLIEHLRMSTEYDLEQEKQARNYHQDITALEEGIRNLLEIFNSCLTANLRYNPHFIYTILYKRELFDTFQNHPMFQDLIWNISSVISYFSTRVRTLEKDSSVTAVLEAIKAGALHWPSDKLKKFPELKFKYVEDDNTVDFFVPYVWRLAFQYSTIYWDPIRIKLFNAFSYT
uniref:Dymeclin n=1 Tax=Syphacia muris TaxID=451379 RepID=A0A158R494_9BILA